MIPERKILIYGAGKFGRLAYQYFNGTSRIVGFIDGNPKLYTGGGINGLPVYSPDILKEDSYTVIIAVKNHTDDIKRKLLEEYNVRDVFVFRANVFAESTEVYDAFNINSDELIIPFKGGLGNQMFQYAVYELFKNRGVNVSGDLSFFIANPQSGREFVLFDAFPNARIVKCNGFLKQRYIDNGNLYVEPILPQVSFYDRMLDIKQGILEGYFQSYKYVEMAGDILREKFVFNTDEDENFQEILDEINSREYVAVHIRRGDYTNEGNIPIYGALYDSDYYSRAIDEIKSRLNNPYFCFFSDDMEFTKKYLNEKHALYIADDMFKKRLDWYDMYLMSKCKHNIIANSTFSWWGAWLNRNPDKIIIAPKNWMATEVMLDVCPPDWIRI